MSCKDRSPEPIAKANPALASVNLPRIGGNIVGLIARLAVGHPPSLGFQCAAMDKRARFRKWPPVCATNTVPDSRCNRFGKITELHSHPYRDVAIYLNNLTTRYAPLFNRSELIRDALIL